MKIDFFKYEATGNDFIIIDNRNTILRKDSPHLWKKMCDRHLGIGADGLILLQLKKGYDFEMYYVNADGYPTSMCGNGGRSIVHLAHYLGILKGQKAMFMAIDGEHEATVSGEIVTLKMKDVICIDKHNTDFILNTGSPHYVMLVDDVMRLDVFSEGRAIRDLEPFVKEGINVNFVQVIKNKTPLLRTYERGVENETLSCGTGTIAAALVLAKNGLSTGRDNCEIKTIGGLLKVWFTKHPNGSFTSIGLEGYAKMVFRGSYETEQESS